MATDLTTDQQDQLNSLVAGRASFDEVERRLYSRDLGTVPSLFKPLLGSTLPDGVVQPESEEQLVAVVKWARKNSVPLVPRGRSTAGYGGALAVQGGVVIDFTRLDQVVHLETETLTATVQPGVVWEDLETALAAEGLRLRLYPSSCPSSTVGGWLAQEGAGYGSHACGWFSENVVSARVILPTGQVQEFAGHDLELICGAEGITGLVTQLTLRVQPATELALFAASFEDAPSLGAFVETLSTSGAPVWSLSFLNPTMAGLKARLLNPTLPHHDPEPRPHAPETYVACAACAKDDFESVEAAFVKATEDHSGTVLSREIAEHEWAIRFKILEIKRSGPSLIPAEVVVPTSELGAALADLEKKIKQPLALECMSVNGEEVILLGFIPHDERAFSFNLAYAASLTVLTVAEKHGGRAYASGIYFPHQAEQIYGAERIERLRKFKREHDPYNLMNPGKLYAGSNLSYAIAAAKAFEWLARPVANWAGLSVDRDRPPEELVAEGVTCSRCGYCLQTCPTFEASQQEGLSARGRVALSKQVLDGELELSAEVADRIFSCTTCMSCTNACPLSVQTVGLVEAVRQRAAEAGKLPNVHRLLSRSLRDKANPYDQDPSERLATLPKPVRAAIEPRVGAQADTLLFFGCVASLADMRIAPATVQLMEAAGKDYTTLGPEELCCGYIYHLMGDQKGFEENASKQLTLFKERGIKRLVSPCAGCAKTFKELYTPLADGEFEALHVVEYLAECVEAGTLAFSKPIKQKVAYHDPCDLGRHLNLYEPPRTLLKAIPGLEYLEFPRNRDNARCCGGGGGVQGFNPDLSIAMAARRVEEGFDAGADLIVSSCPACKLNLNKGRANVDKEKRRVKVMDLAEVLAKAL